MKNARWLNILLFSFLSLLLSLIASCARYSGAESDTPLETVPVTELIAQADTLYMRRAEGLQKVKDGLQLLRRVRVVDGNNYEASWKVSKFNYFVGNNAKDDATRDKAFAEGITAGKAAIRIQPGKPDGYFWTGACLGGQAQVSLLDGAANVPEIRQNMEKVIELQPDYQGAMAYVVLAQIELKTRGILGGSAEKALKYLEKALSLEKNNSFIYLYLAEAYLSLHRKEEARKMLEAMQKLPPNPEYEVERHEAEEKAKTVISQQ